MKDNKKILSEISRIHEIMGVNNTLLNESIWDDLFKAGAKSSDEVITIGGKTAPDELAKAIRNSSDNINKGGNMKNNIDEVLKVARKVAPELVDDLIDRIVNHPSIVDTYISMIADAAEAVKKLVDEGTSLSDAINQVEGIYGPQFKGSQILPYEVYNKFRNEVTDVVGDYKPKPKVDGETPTPGGGSDDGNKITPKELANSDVSLDELTSRKMKDIPDLTEEEMLAFTKNPKWYDFITKLKNNNIISDIFAKQTSLIEQSQKIMKILIDDKNLSSPVKRKLEDKLNRNMLSLVNFNGNKAYMDFYRWADDLFSKSTDRNIKRWWDKTKTKDGFVIMSELEKRGSWSNRFSNGFKDGWKSMSDSTKDFYIRARQVLNPIRLTKSFVNAVASLRGKNPPFKIKEATDAQKMAFRRYFWSGNRTAYAGFSKYMAENGATAAFARLVAQFGRGYIIATAGFTVIEAILKGGFDKGEGFESFKDLVWFTFKEYWNNILGLDYAVPAYTIGKPVVDLVSTIAWAWFSKNKSVTDEMSTWWDENSPEWWSENVEKISNEANDILNKNPNNTDEVPTVDDESSSTDDTETTTDDEDSTPESSGEPGSLDDFRKQLGVEENQVSQDGDIYKWDLGGGVIFNYKFVNGEYVKQD